MSLSNLPTTPNQEATQPEPNKKQKLMFDSALEIAKKYQDLPYSEARTKIMEETPCSKSTAHKAYHKVKNSQKENSAKKGTINIINDPDKNPEFITPNKTANQEEITEITEIKQPTINLTDDQKEQQTLIQDMLRNMYTFIFGQDGLLGSKYGRTQKQCENLADMQFRWLSRRYSPEQMTNLDTILLVGGYLTFVGDIAKTYLEERKKKAAKT